MGLELFTSRRRTAMMICIIGLLGYAILVIESVLANELVLPSGGLLGGDHVAFWTAGRGALQAGWTELYDPQAFEELLTESGAAIDRFGLTWQYPPHAGLLLAPLGLLPYPLSWFLWSIAGLAAFAITTRCASQLPWRTVGLAILSPAVAQAVVTGQTGLFVGAALIGALLLPDRRPVVAGLCAGILTIKPQLGLLLPFAYIAGGYWRSFGVAAATAGFLVLSSVLVFGPESWTAFTAAVFGVADGLGAASYPLPKMITVFASLRSAGLPENAALGAQALTSVIAAYATFRLWRSAATPMARASVTACLVFLATPYAYYYDLAVLTLPFVFVLSRLEDAAPVRRALLAAMWGAPLLMLSAGPFGAQVGLSALVGLHLLTLRAAAPQTRFGLVPA